MVQLIKNISIGADPELFVQNNDGKIISAEGLIGGTKNKPKNITDKGHAIQEDNIMVEFNIPPSRTSEEFIENLEYVEEYLETLLSLKNLKLNYNASAELDPKYLQTKQAKLFGCEPDYNVYLKEANKAPTAKTNLRTCGGHIHVGYDNPSIKSAELIVYAMDILLGLPSIELDKDNRRKEMYGLAGCFRFKEYGVEYRSLSNFWLENKELKKWAFDKTIQALELVNSGLVPQLIEEFGLDIKKAIDTNDKQLAKQSSISIEQTINKLLVKTK